MESQNKKRKNQDSFQTSSKRLKYPTNEKTKRNVPNIEEIFLRFPIIGTDILNQIDNKSLIKLIETNRMASTFIQNERQTWIRDINFYLDKTNKFNNAVGKLKRGKPLKPSRMALENDFPYLDDGSD